MYTFNGSGCSAPLTCSSPRIPRPLPLREPFGTLIAAEELHDWQFVCYVRRMHLCVNHVLFVDAMTFGGGVRRGGNIVFNMRKGVGDRDALARASEGSLFGQPRHLRGGHHSWSH